MPTILTGAARRPVDEHRSPASHDGAPVWRTLFGCGLAITLVGWIDLSLLWFPLRFGNAEWEFGTITAHFGGLPLATVGLALIAVAALALEWRRVTRTAALFAWLVALSLCAISVVFLLDVPLALRAAGPIHSMVVRSILKTGAFALVYIAFYAWLGWSLRRATRTEKAA